MMGKPLIKVQAALSSAYRWTTARIKGIKPSAMIWGLTWDFVREILLQVYPIAVFLVLLYLMTTPTRAGMIRTAAVSPDHPCMIHLARGRRTAIQFWTKPEKVVPGSPGKVQIDFLGDDIDVSPVAADPGNLLVYTRNSRFVLVFQTASESTYDDVVKLIPESSRLSQPIRLDRDTYVAEAFQMTLSKPGRIEESLTTGLVMDGGRHVEFDGLSQILPHAKFIQCGACVINRKDDQTSFYCTEPPKEIQCRASGGVELHLQRKDG